MVKKIRKINLFFKIKKFSLGILNNVNKTIEVLLIIWYEMTLTEKET